jgi:hypothetical protein
MATAYSKEVLDYPASIAMTIVSSVPQSGNVSWDLACAAEAARTGSASAWALDNGHSISVPVPGRPKVCVLNVQVTVSESATVSFYYNTVKQ